MKTKLSPGLRWLCLLVCAALFYCLWEAYTLLVGAIGLAILARRGWDWCRTRPDSVWTAALVGAPFFILLAVAGLTR